ncbi:NAD-glutamate dehydrogenase [gamma proteobacterium HdN1]|nr:NAD-glutamate dehydrogenase [gamma proteobacterium HdN1]
MNLSFNFIDVSLFMVIPSPREEFSSFITLLDDEFRARYGAQGDSASSERAAEIIMQFARYFYANVPIDELARKRMEDLYGMTLAIWDFLQVRGKNQPRIRVFNPRFEDHGWQTTHTIVELLVDDRPFLVDSIAMELNRRGLTIHSVVAEAFFSERDGHGHLREIHLSRESDAGVKEALIHFEVDRQSEAQTLADIGAHLTQILRELEFAVTDFHAMLARTEVLSQEFKYRAPKEKVAVREVSAFLHWLCEHHFTFLAMREYQVQELGSQGDAHTQKGVESEPLMACNSCRLVALPDRDLGMIRCNPELDLMALADGPVLLPEQSLVFAKSGTRSRVHRPLYMDFIAVRHFDASGSLRGETRILGLFTSRVVNNAPSEFPLLRRKLRTILRRSRLEIASHNGKLLLQILETLPREELFQTPTAELLRTALDVLHIQERRRLKIFMRKSQYGHFVTCMIYAPRDSYTTALRKRFEQVLTGYLNVQDYESYTYVSDTSHARLYIVMRADHRDTWNFDLKEIEDRMIGLARSWTDQLSESLVEYFGEERSSVLFTRYTDAFPTAYREDFSSRMAASDIDRIESLLQDSASGAHELAVSLYRPLDEEAGALRCKIYHARSAIAFSDVLPMLENLGLRVLGGHPYLVEPKECAKVWIYDFSVRHSESQRIELDQVKGVFQEAFHRVWYGNAENDPFNRLTLEAGLGWREVALLRAYAQYFRQIRFPFTPTYIKDALVEYPEIAHSLVVLFDQRFNPSTRADDAVETALVQGIRERLDKVVSLDHDRILRRFLDVMLATLRTNFYQLDSAGEMKDFISFKMNPHLIPEMPKPLPQFEIFVYSPRVEGVHLRGGKVARGGIRWSDRREDFRTEVLGLVKAQQVKNAVIVPVGAKGGFIPKQIGKLSSRDAIQEEAIECYKIFIRGLLDITDNLHDGRVIAPQQVVRKDDDDPYLVVAADKGTAKFSDIANAVAAEYHFWLGDAFASGGSAGYDHKGIGITARGAWISVQRHFRELGIDVQRDPITVVGIGDMSGDVFGNGLLRSRSVKLVAAFDHRHVFIDPDPDPEASYAERERLFLLKQSSWDSYDKALISKGGGVFSRAAKSVSITPEMRMRFEISEDRLTPVELISKVLRAPVDLVWNGGIGTYIKSSRESNADVGDKANDVLRVNGGEVRARVIGEGGNLGMTQLGRIEYALAGGLLNTDFIDNSGGVDCSDHEVNIKILVDSVVHNGDLTLKHRNQLLAQMTDDVAELVLKNNYRQTLCISIARTESVYRMGEYRRYIRALVESGRLDRALEFIPAEDELLERQTSKKGLVRPELAILLSYTKEMLKELLAQAELHQDPYLQREAQRAFPAVLCERFPEALQQHKLLPQLVATQVANDIVNYMGITFMYRMVDAAGSQPGEIARAFIAARDAFDLEKWWHQIEQMDGRVGADDQLEMMRQLIRLVRRATRWFLRNHRCSLNVGEIVARFQPGVREVASSLPSALCGRRREEWQSRFDQLTERGVQEGLATYIAGIDSMMRALAIIQAAELAKCPVEKAAAMYFAIGDTLELYWMFEEISHLQIDNHWQALAREAYRDDLDWQQRTLTVGVLNAGFEGDVNAQLVRWSELHGDMIARWRRMVEEIRTTETQEFAMYGVALRELMDLAQTTLHTDANTGTDCSEAYKSEP